MERSTGAAPIFPPALSPVPANHIPSSSPAFATPVYPVRLRNPPELATPSILPISLPPATLRPLAFRIFTKKHNLTLTSPALQTLAHFIGKHCGTGWREEGLAEKVLDEIARTWKKNGGGVILPGEGEDLNKTLRTIEGSMSGGRIVHTRGLTRQESFALGSQGFDENTAPVDGSRATIGSEDSQASLGLSTLGVDNDEKLDQSKDPRQWLKVVGAFDQPRLLYNTTQKHFEIAATPSSLLPDPSHKTHLFRHRYNLIHQRLLRNESFQTSSVAVSQNSSLQRSSSIMITAQQAYKITPIANLLGRSGSTHLLLGLLTTSPTGTLAVSDLTAGIALDLSHARPIPENGAWFTPGMIVLVDGVYEEEGTASGPGLDGNGGVGGTIGGKFIGFSVGGPPCERREATLGVSGVSGNGNLNAGGGFGWVDFLGVGSERASGSTMRKLEHRILGRSSMHTSADGRSRVVIMGEVNLDNVKSLQALKKVLGYYAAEPAEVSPMIVVLIGNFVRHAVLAGGGSGGSIEYKEYFDSLASTLSDYPTVLQAATFIFVPGDNDPWASAYSAGAATVLPKKGVPELFTSRIKRVFAAANAETSTSGGEKTSGEAVWSTNPARLTLFGPAHEVVFFRDDISGRFRRGALRFKPVEAEQTSVPENEENLEPLTPIMDQKQRESMDVGHAVEVAESHVPASKGKENSDQSVSANLLTARKLVKTILDQGYLSPFPLSNRPVLWDYAGALQLYPLPSALVLLDPEAPPFALTYEGCHVMNPGPLVSQGRRGVAQWMEYDARTRRGKMRETRF
jgi:DNA polymerase epsilon subunit 2